MEPSSSENGKNYRLLAIRNIIIVIGLLILAAKSLSFYVGSVLEEMRLDNPNKFASMENGDQSLRFPTDLDDLRVNVGILKAAEEYSFAKVLVGFILAFLFKQTFAVPGSALLNVLASAVLGIKLAFPLVTVMTACGATCCYFLSHFLGKPIIEHFFKQRLLNFRVKIAANQSDLFSFLVFLRLVPFTPNWFVNIASPILNIPTGYFFLSVLLGLMPYNFICCQAGEILSQLHSTGDIFDGQTLAKLLGIAVLYIAPKQIYSRCIKSSGKRKKSTESS
eukprot:Nk52_evm10s355 gene=Nk52_evmTU10s355